MVELFEVRIVQKYRSAFTRQIGEAIHIRVAKAVIINYNKEYKHYELPKLSVTRPRQTVAERNKHREIEDAAE